MLMFLRRCKRLPTGGHAARQCRQPLLRVLLPGLSHRDGRALHPPSIPGIPASRAAGGTRLIPEGLLVGSAGASSPQHPCTTGTAQLSFCFSIRNPEGVFLAQPFFTFSSDD